MRVWDTVEAGLQAAHRMVTGTLKTKEERGRRKRVKRKGDEDKGDLSFWEDLVEASEMRMGRWCDELAEKIAWWEEGEK